MVTLKPAYEPVSRRDGWRVLVERLWPRGVAKEKLALDDWLKELAPSGELRKWFGHERRLRRRRPRRSASRRRRCHRHQLCRTAA